MKQKVHICVRQLKLWENCIQHFNVLKHLFKTSADERESSEECREEEVSKLPQSSIYI